MGTHKNIGFDKFPKQGDFLGKEVTVCFDYDTDNSLYGEIVRYDVEEPFLKIIQLRDGRYVMSTECQYSPAQ